jgi:hypothetical protein
MRRRCIIIANEDGDLITPSKTNPNVGYYFIQTLPDGEEDAIEIRTTSTYGKIDSLRIRHKIGEILDGKIIILDQLTPFYQTYPPMHYKYSTNPKVPCKIDGKIIFRRLIYVADQNAEDVIIKENNFEELE